MTNLYDKDGRLRETRFRNPDRTEGSAPAKYDEYGQPIRFAAEVTYSFENGRKVKTEVFKPNRPGVHRVLGFAEGSRQGSWAQDAALAATFYDALGRPLEIVFYDDEHVQISRLVRTYDERGRVIIEENQLLSPRFFERQTSTQGEQMPKEAAQLLAQAFTQRPMRMIYKYDGHDRVIEETQDMGALGSERTISLYNDRGDLSTQRHYSTHQGDVPIDDGNILTPPRAPETPTAKP